MNARGMRFLRRCGCAVIGMTAFGNGEAAQWLLSPSARITSEYTDNPRLVVDGGNSTGGAVGELSAVLRARTERSEWLLQPRTVWARYPDEDLLDNDNQYFKASVTHARERTRWSASADFVRDM